MDDAVYPETEQPEKQTGSQNEAVENEVMTKAEAEAYAKQVAEEFALKKLRGSGKRIKQLEAELEKIAEEKRLEERSKMEEQGKFKELNETISQERNQFKEKAEGLAAKLAEYEEREKARIERIEAGNAEMMEKLPEHIRDLVPANLDPESKKDHIAKLISTMGQAEHKGNDGFLSGAIRPPQPAQNLTPEQRKEQLIKRSFEHMMGKKGKGK